MKVRYRKPKMLFELEIPPRLIVALVALTFTAFSQVSPAFISVLQYVFQRF